MMEELDRASAEDVLPGYNRVDDWERLSRRIPRRRKLAIPLWAAAASLVMGTAAYLLHTASYEQPHPVAVAAPPAWLQMPENIELPVATAEVATVSQGTVAAGLHRAARPVTREIYNGTPCPIAVRINQVKSCPNMQPEPISSSSTLLPAGSAQITYENHETVASDCSVAVKEIEIKSIATGDVILLNASSTPTTVQEAFRIMTREREGKILAGAFDHDCRKREKKLSLELDNSRGRITIE